MKRIEIIVDQEGKASIEAHGFVGPSCLDALGAFNALGDVLSEEPKPEYYETNRESQTLEQ
jgi:hypothetical protein